jgi:DNA-binding transcriptional LysR family regulator
MDFAALQIFKAVVDEGGIGRAAKKLHRVQSNVTTRIRQLEAALGTRLFVRNKRRLYISPEGELFLSYAERVLKLWDEARAAVHGDAPLGVLRVGTLESTAASRLPPLLSRYHRLYPAVRVELTTGTSDALVQAVSHREVDAAFVVDCSATQQLESMRAFVEELVVVAPKSHPKIERAQDVRADTIISFPAGCAYRRLLQGWLGAGEIVPARILELSSYHAIIACVAAGSGIALVPKSVLNVVPGSKDVCVYPLPAHKRRATTTLVWRRGESSAALNAFKAQIKAVRLPATAR